MRQRVALFIDGASRATLLPFAPLLLGHLMRKGRDDVANPLPESMWGSVTWATAAMMATYMLGRAAGTAMGAHSGRVQRFYCNAQKKAFSRTVGAVLALHLFSFGSGLHEPVSLYFMRLLMGFLVGILVRVGSGNRQGFDERSLEHIVDSGIAKIWLMGFAVSILTSGVLYYPLCHSPFFTMITGGAKTSWSWMIPPLSFIAVVHITDTALQFCCGRFLKPELAVEFKCDQRYELMSSSKDESVTFEGVHGSAVKRRSTGENRVRLGSGNRARLGSHNTRSRLGSSNSYSRRVRLDSGMSNDEFYDCESRDGDVSVTWGFDDEMGGSPMNNANGDGADNYYSIANYVNGKCVYEDGSPSPVQATLCVATIPRAWEHIHKSKAGAKWEETKRWRMERKLWKIHAVPHTPFATIKDAYPHYVHGFNKLGYPVVYERPGGMTLKKCFSEGSITVDDMLRHYTYFMEFLSNKLCSRPEVREVLDKRPENRSQSHWGFMVVMDVSSLSLGILSGDVLRYLQKAGKVNVDNYPNSTTMALLVNSPFWLSGAFGTIKSILPENTQADILSSANQLEGMRKHIDDDQIPKEFGGSSPYALGQHPFEKELESMVALGMHNTDDDDDEEYLLDQPFVEIPPHVNQVGFESHEDRGLHDIEIGKSHIPPLLSSDSADYQNADSRRNPLHDSFDDDAAYTSRHSISLRQGHKWTNSKYYTEEYVFMMISVRHYVWCAAQGSLETILPVWLLTPQVLGGLGYEPRRSAFALFTASIVAMWLLRSKVAKSVACIPTNSPMRGFRIGVGAQAVLLLLLPFVPFISNFDGMLVLTTNGLLCASMFIASIIGRMSSAKLHSIASSAYVEKLSLRCDHRTFIGQALNMIADIVQKGGFSYMLGVTGEMTGALMVAPIAVWSAQKEHTFPFDASFSFYTAAALCIALYMSSFSFRVSGEKSSRKADRSDEIIHQSTSIGCSTLRDVIAVSASDMASMFEENNWSTSSALGRNQGVIISEDDSKYNMKKI
jgi:hypothetical protein